MRTEKQELMERNASSADCKTAVMSDRSAAGCETDLPLFSVS